jgi:hypothetical protein
MSVYGWLYVCVCGGGNKLKSCMLSNMVQRCGLHSNSYDAGNRGRSNSTLTAADCKCCKGSRGGSQQCLIWGTDVYEEARGC